MRLENGEVKYWNGGVSGKGEMDNWDGKWISGMGK